MVTKIRLRKELSWRKVGTTIVILDLDASIYLSATGAAVVIWECLAAGMDETTIVERVTDTFDVDAETALRDVQAFVRELRTRRLLA